MTIIRMSVWIVGVAPVPRNVPEVGAAAWGVGPAAKAMCRSETAEPYMPS